MSIVSVSVPDFLEGTEEESLYVKQCVDILEKGKDLLLVSSASIDRDEIEKSMEAGKKKQMTLPEISEYTQELMGNIANQVLEQVKVSGVFLTGGDTSIGFLKQAEAEGSFILSEIATGIPLMQIEGGKYDKMKVVTKAGAFGKEDAILFGLRKLKEK